MKLYTCTNLSVFVILNTLSYYGYLLKKSLYNLKQPPCAWHLQFIDFVSTLNFFRGVSNHSLLSITLIMWITLFMLHLQALSVNSTCLNLALCLLGRIWVLYEYDVYLSDNLFSWYVKQKPTLSQSSADSEYVGD
jgi:hypothetical protein